MWESLGKEEQFHILCETALDGVREIVIIDVHSGAWKPVKAIPEGEQSVACPSKGMVSHWGAWRSTGKPRHFMAHVILNGFLSNCLRVLV